MYKFVDATVFRATAHPPEVNCGRWPDLCGTAGEAVTDWRDWLAETWRGPGVADAVEVASPVLARRVAEIVAGRQVPNRDIRRAALSVMRYVLRARSRATPFGLFAGVAPARIGPNTHVRVGREHQPVARVDAAVLAEVITRLESCEHVRRRLWVVCNDLAFTRDDLLVSACRQNDVGEPVEVSVRHTEAVRTVMDAARTPTRLADIEKMVARDFPDRPPAVIHRFLTGLVSQGFLITSLRPPMTETDPLSHVIHAATEANADIEPDTAHLLANLRELQALLAEHNHPATITARGRELRTAMTRRARAVTSTERPISVDLRLDAEITVPHTVIREVETTASVLTVLTPHPRGTPAWRDYHGRFLERYGPGALVPLHDLLHHDSGLGYPAGYRGSRLRPFSEPGLSERDVLLLRLAQNAAMRRDIEITLDQDMINRLTVGAPTTLRAQPHTEVRFRIHAASRDALGRGEFDLAITGVSRAAGTTTGRFLHLLDGDERERMAKAYTTLSTVNEHAILAQVSGPPAYRRTENVARAPETLPHLITVGEHGETSTEAIPLRDLVVAADVERFHLFSMSRGAPVEPVVFNAVEFTNHTHPLLRFLCEITTARTAPCAPFSWGAAHQLPFRPRIRHGRSILAPATWTLVTDDLPGLTTPHSQWTDHLDSWRDKLLVPQVVSVGDDDRRHVVDLHEPAHQHVLRTDLARHGHLTLREAPDPAQLGWINGRAHDFVVPLSATGPPVPRRSWTNRLSTPDHGHVPGSERWLYVKLYGHPDRHTTILTKHLPDLLSRWDTTPEWWFLRYQDPDRHLRLRIRIDGPEDFPDTARRVTGWTSDLCRRGLLQRVQWDTYHPETARFGHRAMSTAESLFAADSTAVLAQLRAVAHPDGPHPQAVTAASMIDLAVSLADNIDAAMTQFIQRVTTSSGAALERKIRDQAIHLANPDQAALHAIPGGPDIAAAWRHRRAAIHRYRAVLTTTGELSPENLLPDLTHLHHARMTGIDPDNEQICRRLARAAALSWATRQGPPR